MIVHNKTSFSFAVTESERRRLQDAFRRLGGGGSGGTVGKSVFVSDVLGAGFPAGLAGMSHDTHE